MRTIRQILSGSVIYIEELKEQVFQCRLILIYMKKNSNLNLLKNMKVIIMGGSNIDT